MRSITLFQRSIQLLIVSIVSHAVVHAEPAESRPRLQIINASAEKADIFWLNEEGKEIPNGTVEAGKSHQILTTIGHRFAVVGQQSKTRLTTESIAMVQGFRFAPGEKDGIPDFYTQRIETGGFPIVASATVNPYALKEAAYLVDQMLSQRDDVRKAMVKSGARLCIIAYNEYTTDLPEFTGFADGKSPYPGVSAKDFWDARARGTGGSVSDPYCTCGEENLLGYPGDPYKDENILIHEFAHNIHLRGMTNIDPTFDQRLEKAYQKAMAAGLWKNKYAATNRFEYFAEGVQSWFGNNRENDHDHNHVNTRQELIEYDPTLAKFCREVFGETILTYTKPATRLTGHMKGYDPSKAPTFKWPDRLKKAKDEIRKANIAEDQP
ncbi:hypothetical protein NT6N_15550 [Oceaniferula spumae]|uniref:Secreted protein n=1 Tax=Oceaniferula spumae TaxID=2979115 RepID=A0AAT9FKL6_9BACT